MTRMTRMTRMFRSNDRTPLALALAIGALLSIPLAAPVAAQQPDPESPRYRAVMALEALLSSGDDDAVASFLRDRVAPDRAAPDGPLAATLADLRRSLRGAQLRGAQPEGPFAVQVMFGLAGGGQADLRFELEAEPPHRFTAIETLRLDRAPARPRVTPSMTDDEMVSALETYLDTLVADDRFSGAVLLARHGKPIFRRAYGEASKRWGIPNRPDTKINLGSMNKMFTGLAIVQLVEQGKLSLDDTVGRHLPDYPNREVADTVTISHLLTHTSGMGSYWNEAYEQTWTTIRTLDALLETFVDEPLQFEPGSQWGYSNAGPVVLGLIIERVTGQSYYDYMRRHVYERAGMHDTDCYAMDEPVPNLAIGYTKMTADGRREPDGPWRNNYFMHSVKGGPAGGGFSTVDDLLRYATAVQEHVLLGPEATRTYLAGRVRLGRDRAYACLIDDTRAGGHRAHGHNGGAPGISADFSFYPDLGYTFAVLANIDRAATPVADFIRDMIESRPPSLEEGAAPPLPAPLAARGR